MMDKNKKNNIEEQKNPLQEVLSDIFESDNDDDLFENVLTVMEERDDNKFYLDLGDKIRKAREEAGVTLVQLAKKVKLTGAAVSNYEAGIRQIPVHILIEFSRILNKPIHAFLGPEAEPAISIKDTLINTLERYTEVTYAKKIADLQNGRLSEVMPQPLIPVTPEICKNHDMTIRLKTQYEEIYTYHFIKKVRPKYKERVRTIIDNEEAIIKLEPNYWVVARIGDSNDYEITQFKNVIPGSIAYYPDVDLQTYNVAGIVLGKVERLVEI